MFSRAIRSFKSHNGNKNQNTNKNSQVKCKTRKNGIVIVYLNDQIYKVKFKIYN